uniref:Uncharacterized protein n=1 Tax=Arundo donax TaxID=35708 RepID=A0A0A9DVP7_ARUDO
MKRVCKYTGGDQKKADDKKQKVKIVPEDRTSTRMLQMIDQKIKKRDVVSVRYHIC